MNTITARRNTARRSRGLRARRIGSLSIAGAAACLVLTPGLAHASQIPLDIPPDTTAPATAHTYDIDCVVTVRKTQMAADRAGHPAPAAAVARAPLSDDDFVIVEKSTHRTVPAKGPTCFIPESLDSWSRRLIAVQTCGKAYVVPALYVARAPYGMPAPIAIGHCGHQSLHQPSSSLGLPVSAWYTPTSC
jgi:hypothetical protein